MIDERVCQKKIWDNWKHRHCRKPVKIEIEGKFYCETHNPIKIEKKRKLRELIWEKENKRYEEHWHREALMHKILGTKTIKELEEMAEENE